MASLSQFLWCISGLRSGLELLDASIPQLSPHNWFLKKPVLKKTDQISLANFEAMKDKTCIAYGLEPSRVKIVLSDRVSFMETHGNRYQGILEIKTSLISQLSNKSNYDKICLKTLNDWIEIAPENPDEFGEYVKASNMTHLKNIIPTHGFALTEQEILFIMHHEIGGHLFHADGMKIGVLGTILRIGALAAAEGICMYVPLPLIGPVSRLGLYLLAETAITKIVHSRIEVSADKTAVKSALTGGQALLRRLMLYKTLFQSEIAHSQGISHQISHLMGKEGRYEDIYERFIRISKE
jgi:hypothetical protein